MNDMIQNLQAAGLNPITIDENTAMNDLPTATTETAIDRFMQGAKALQKAVARAVASDETLFNQRLEIQQLREAVTNALAGNGDFDTASKAFKAANNKLDKLIDARNSNLANAKAGVDALRRALDAVADDLRDLED